MEKQPHHSSVLAQALAFFKPAAKKHSAKSARSASARQRGKPTRSPSVVAHHNYQSASVSFGKCHGACDAVRALQGTRFLVRDVPPLPLPDCNSSTCNCSYVRHKDRRGFTVDRRALFSLNANFPQDTPRQEQRTNRCRRIIDESKL